MATDKLFHNFSLNYPVSLLKLLKIKDAASFKASSYTFKQTERRSDIVFEHQYDKAQTVFLEYQGYADEWIYHRLLSGILFYCQEQNFNGEILPVVIFLQETHRQAARFPSCRFAGQEYLQFEPMVLNLSKMELKDLENSEDIYLTPLYPLVNISITQIKKQAFSWAERIQRHPGLEAPEKVNLLALLGGFVSHRIKKLNLTEINQLLGGFKMEDTQVGRDLIAIGIEQGIEKGIEKGIAKGIEKGIEKGKHQLILSLLSYKFKNIPEDVVNQINTITEDVKLDEIALRTLELTSLDQLKKLLN